MEEVLKRFFGYDNFRPMQREIIEAVVDGKDALVVMPTGGGKSLCYQIPALHFSGITIVVSPLISLMKDQVDNLKANGISAEYINSTLSFAEIFNIQERLLDNEIKILYIAPERLALESFRGFISRLKISLIAIDEAHCISEWGHDFRPDYKNLKCLKTLFPKVPIIALTATATGQVQEDILNNLILESPQIFVSGFDRKNLTLKIVKKKNSFDRIVDLVKKNPSVPIIIYCFSRKDAETIANNLIKEGFEALPYHAGLDNEIRKKTQDLFIKDKVNIVVATVAFGMGIDKPDVRLVIHHTFPKSLEGYYQEIGRAGRDGLDSECIMFYSQGDKRKHEFFIDQMGDSVARYNAQKKLSDMIDYCESRTCRRRHLLNYFGEEYPKDNCDNCDVCMKPEEEAREMGKILSLFPKKEETSVREEYDEKLFEKLRNLRKQIAWKKNVPPFVIFNDASLIEMATKFPKTETEFLNINGVGNQKLMDFGDIFLDEIRDYLMRG